MASFGTTLVFESPGDLVIVGLALLTNPGFLQAERSFSAALEKQRSVVMVPTCTIKFGDGGRNTLIEVCDADAMITGRIAAFHAQGLDTFTAEDDVWWPPRAKFPGCAFPLRCWGRQNCTKGTSTQRARLFEGGACQHGVRVCLGGLDHCDGAGGDPNEHHRPVPQWV